MPNPKPQSDPDFIPDARSREWVAQSPSNRVALGSSSGNNDPDFIPAPTSGQYEGVSNPPNNEGEGVQDMGAPAEPMFQQGMRMAGDVGIGALKGAGSTAYNIGKFIYPDVIAKHLTGVVSPEQEQKVFMPTNTAQSFGKGAEQIGEFLLPGGLEKEGAAKLATMAPRLGRAAAPLARMATSALSSGALNAAQGGSPVTGALLGAGGAGLAEGARVAAPYVAELATTGKASRGGQIGKTILNDTSGIFPSGIRQSAQEKLNVLNPELDAAARAASVKSNKAIGLLPAPAQEVPLAAKVRRPRQTPMAFDAEVNPASPRMTEPVTYAGRAPAEDLQYLSGSEHPELSGRIPTNQGVWIRPAEQGAGPIPTTLTNPSVSLAPARGAAQSYVNKALAQNEPKFYKGAQKLAKQVSVDLEGNPIPENVTPYDALMLKRGVGNAVSAAKWKPGYRDPFSDAQKAVYGELNKGFIAAVPEAEGLNTRISNLIPVSKEPNSWGRPFTRYMSPAAGAVFGGVEGYNHGGLAGAAQGALTGATVGYLAPGALNAAARTAYNPATQRFIVPALIGGALQYDRDKKEK